MGSWEALDLRGVQNRLLSMLDEVSNIFSRAGVRYFLSFGTLLGAVRHQGFIPWDDDIDLHVHEDDYQLALESLRAELPQHLRVKEQSRELAWDIDFRIVDSQTRLQSNDRSLFEDAQNGLFIDFFKAERCHRSLAWSHALAKKWQHQKNRAPENFRSLTRFVYPALMLFNTLSYRLPGKKHWFINDKVNSVSFRDEEIWPLNAGRFENRTLPIPANVDRLLRAWYGDYWTPLKPDMQQGHFSVCYLRVPELREGYE